jgi:hypothetical protein
MKRIPLVILAVLIGASVGVYVLKRPGIGPFFIKQFLERQMISLRSELLFTLTGRVSPPQEIGASPSGQRRIIPVEGGEFEGPKLRGKVLPGGADWMLVRPDGVAQINVRMTLQTDDGDLIFMK